MGLEEILVFEEDVDSLKTAKKLAIKRRTTYKGLLLNLGLEFRCSAGIAYSPLLKIRHRKILGAETYSTLMTFGEEENPIAKIDSTIIYGSYLRSKKTDEIKTFKDFLQFLIRKKTEKYPHFEEMMKIYAMDMQTLNIITQKIRESREEDYLEKNSSLINSLTRNEISVNDTNRGKKPTYELAETPKKKEIVIPTVEEMKKYIDEYVIGQEEAKKDIIIGARSHYLAIKSNEEKGTNIEKNNIILMGPTGCGKTHLIKTLAKLLDVPCAFADATEYTAHGYIGNDVEHMFSLLFFAAKGNMETAEKGILFIDEFDKINRKQDIYGKDVNGEEVQSAMLTKMEAGEADISRYIGRATRPMKTKDILFILGGSFSGLENVVKARIKTNEGIGFNRIANYSDLLPKATIEDILNFGIKKELVGRCTVLTYMKELTVEEMRRILTEPKNSFVQQYKDLAAIDNIGLEFEEDALVAIAEKATKHQLGARALKSILHKVTKDIFFNQQATKITITNDYVESVTKY